MSKRRKKEISSERDTKKETTDRWKKHNEGPMEERNEGRNLQTDGKER